MEQPCLSVFKESTSDLQTPDVLVCPISRSLMHDPVVVVETGQVYDSQSILRWFEAGNNTCPLTGVTLTSQKVARLPSLRRGVWEWAEQHGMSLDPPELLTPKKKGFGELDNPCQSLSLLTAKGVSVYDPEAVVGLMTRHPVPETYAALVVLREILQHADEAQFKQIRDLIDMDFLKYLLNEDGLKKPAARLLVSLNGALNVEELTSLFAIPDIDLQIELMTRLVEHICTRHSAMNRGASHLGLSQFFGRIRRFCSFPRRCFSSRR